MATRLELLKKSILSMSMEEKFEIIRDVRESRKMSKQPIVKERKAREARTATDKMIDKMSVAEKAALMAMLGVKADETGS